MLVTSYRNGSTAGTPPPPRSHVDDKPRGDTKGWTADVARRQTKWLYAIDAPQLSGIGFAVTLTVRDLPATPLEWSAARRAWVARQERAGAIRVHWLTEWQRRGVPHLHGCVYFPEPPEDERYPGWWLDHFCRLHRDWLEVSQRWGTQARGQHIDVIDGPIGWLQYLSKHASRGAQHYQRTGHPVSWDRTGRMWGHRGEWPTDDPMRFDMPAAAGYQYRRLVRSWTIAQARSTGDAARVHWARRMLRCNDPRLSAVRGVSGWLPEEISLALVAHVAGQGYPVIQRG